MLVNYRGFGTQVDVSAGTADRVSSDVEAIELARSLVPAIAEGASERDRHRLLPHAEVDRLSRAGLLAITVPRSHGGAEVSAATLVEVVRLLATADASVAQIPQSHFTFLDALRRTGSAAQQDRYYSAVLDGARLANAQVERTTTTVLDDTTTLTPRPGSDGFVLNGTKYYSTGSAHAQVLVVRAVVEPGADRSGARPPKVLVFVDASAAGVQVDDDWNGLGQRTTGSGTVRLADVAVEIDQVVPFDPLFEHRSTYGARAQILHSAIDVGIARSALDAGRAAAERARPWFEAGVDRAIDDPLLAQVAGELEVSVRSAESLLSTAAEAIDRAESGGSTDLAVEASIATATAKVVASRASLDASSRLFELGGTRASLDDLNLSRYWRDARTHTLHDPERWKVRHIGVWTLSRTLPPVHGQI